MDPGSQLGRTLCQVNRKQCPWVRKGVGLGEIGESWPMVSS